MLDRISFLLQTSNDGNQTTSTLSIIFTRTDGGKYLSCQAYNKAFSTEPLEDGWKLDIHCKFPLICFSSTLLLPLFPFQLDAGSNSKMQLWCNGIHSVFFFARLKGVVNDWVAY